MIGDIAVASRFTFFPVTLASRGARTGLPATTGVTGPLSSQGAVGLSGDGGASGGKAESM